MTSKTTVLAVVAALAVFGVILTGGAIALIANHESVPPEIWTLAGTVIGSLAALLVSTRTEPPA